jgi:hypothetical protein
VRSHRGDDTGTHHNDGVSDQHDALYRERLLPGAAWWLVVAAFVAMVAIAYGAALGTRIGLLTGLCLGAIAAAGLWFGSPVVRVHSTGVRCGRAWLPVSAVGACSVLHGNELRLARRGADPDVPATAYSVMPVWFPPSAVAISVTDSRDPHRAWLVGTRNTERFANAVTHIATATPGAG